MPFEKNEKLRKLFIKFYSNEIRVGRMLEILDYIAGNTAYIYSFNENKNNSNFLVTVCVDNIKFMDTIYAD